MSDGSAIHMSAAEGSRNWYSPLLAPISRVYGAGVGLRTALYKGRWLEAKRLNRPVVSVGNLTAGGTGKTPLVILLAKMLEQAGRKPSILTRGYKRRSRESCIVIEPGRERQPDSDEVGDEPALLARRLTQVPWSSRPIDTAPAGWLNRALEWTSTCSTTDSSICTCTVTSTCWSLIRHSLSPPGNCSPPDDFANGPWRRGAPI